MDIAWLDGKDAKGQYILEIDFANGGKGYIKNPSLEKITHYYNTLFDENCTKMTIWTPDNKVVESKFNMRQFKKAS
jgi:hypothetical protein